jgi:hypothetical protein
MLSRAARSLVARQPALRTLHASAFSLQVRAGTHAVPCFNAPHRPPSRRVLGAAGA